MLAQYQGIEKKRSEADTSSLQATGCCPSSSHCCSGSRYCKAKTTDVCCGSRGTCPGGYSCHSRCQCVERGGTCCSNGRYCIKGYKCCKTGCAPIGGQCCSNGQTCDTGNICVVNRRTGRYGCCTDLSCTAYIDSGSTVALTTSTPKATKTTAAPRVTTSAVNRVVYRYYYWTLTWYADPFSHKPALLTLTVSRSYYSYDYTYVIAQTKSTLTTTYVTTTTVISAYQRNSADASSELSRISSTKFGSGYPTPTDATTALLTATGEALPSRTASASGGDSGDNGNDVGFGIGNVGGGPVVDGPAGGASVVHGSVPSLTLWAFAMGAMAIGTGMLLL